uniref:Constitutive coactivator of peroxisome proliferator-activated receptor gamma n=1 Tax=Leptobrachium leishanense TaxID=445787 RepID=A0A8C5PBE5_9ANUR
MGIKGLLGFVQNTCPDTCHMVNLQTLANRHKTSYPGCIPTIVVDAMGCLRKWYTPHDWIHGGQWKEYLCSLQDFIDAFQTAGIRLVFIFDGVIEEKKREEWVKRRLRDKTEISKIFNFIKTRKQQPDRSMFFIPSGIATFTRFALKNLGQEVFCSHVEADYEVASYGLAHNCLGILGEDSDYLIFNTVPYFSINKLILDTLVTLMYSRENLCRHLNLHICDLPLLACLLGNDIIPEHMLRGFQRNCTAQYRSQYSHPNQRTQVIQSVANFISSIRSSPHGINEVKRRLPTWFDSLLLQKGLESYVLPHQTSPWLPTRLLDHGAYAKETDACVCPDKEIVQIVLDDHFKGDNVMICNVLFNGVADCSNTLEDDDDREIPGQALVYKLARQHIYAILFGTGAGSMCSFPVVKEWYIYPENQLLQPDLVEAVPLSVPGGTPSLRDLLLDGGANIQMLRFHTLMACFQVEFCKEELNMLEHSLAATCCLLIYLALKVNTFSLEDIDAFLSHALCLGRKSAEQLKHLQLPIVDSRAVHLAFLYLRGLVTLMGANSACGYPFNMMDILPWNTFDGKLFHQKYLLSHEGSSVGELMKDNETLIPNFKKLKNIIFEECAAQKRTLKSQKRSCGHLPGDHSKKSLKGSRQKSERHY